MCQLIMESIVGKKKPSLCKQYQYTKISEIDAPN